MESPKRKLATPSLSHYPHSCLLCQSVFSTSRLEFEHSNKTWTSEGYWIFLWKKSFLETYSEAPSFLIHWPKCSSFELFLPKSDFFSNIRSWWCKAARPGKSGQRAKGFPRTKNQKQYKCEIIMIQTSCKWKITRRMCLANGQHFCKIGAKRYGGSCPRDIHGSCLLPCSKQLFWCPTSWSVWSTFHSSSLPCRFTRLDQKCHKWPGSTLLRSALQSELPIRIFPQGSPVQHRLLLGQRDNARRIRPPKPSTNMLPVWC